jgi:antitoxin component YwqK of YwqJK toxin-antitoxin module
MYLLQLVDEATNIAADVLSLEVSMKSRFWPMIACAGTLVTGCSNKNNGDVVSQQFVHKYGFNVSAQEWEERAQDGQTITMLKNGVKVTRAYENGQLHGTSTHTFPHSTVVEKLLVYDQGTLLKEVINDAAGIPMREDVYEFDDRTIITLWDEKGSPISIEEYDDDTLMEGKYYTPDHELEGQVEVGFGTRVKRDRSGLLLCRDRIEKGMIAERTSYHPNGQIHTVSHYQDYQLQGEQIKNTASGKPLMTLHWNHGVLDGPKIVYRNGIKIAEIPYLNGLKHGTETHFDDLGNMTAEIQWKNDKKHGFSRFYSEETVDNEWFYKGQAVNEEKFEMLENREKLIAEVSGE